MPDRCAATVEIPEVGPVAIVKSERARHIRITVSADRTVRLTVPRRESIERGRQFLLSKVPWIIRNLRRATELEKPRGNLPDLGISEPQACEMLIGRLQELAGIHHFNYGKVSLRNQKTKWGSCSSKNNISLNVNLVRLPDQLRDYVLLHELVHTRIKNHSKKFWAELDKVLGGGAKKLAKQLRKCRLAHDADSGQLLIAGEGLGQLI
jgi:predicted metal-dependent hydrolase